MEKPSSRDILWSKFISKKDTVFMMVNHWPSRRGGEDKSEPNRLEAAKNARIFIDSVLKVNPKAKIIFMGDLNDYPTNKAPMLIAEKLQPQIIKTSGEFGGTYFYNNSWDILDHILVSAGNFGKKCFKVIPNSGKIYSPKYLMEEYKGNIQPFRTYGGKKYLGGYSDHLPVSITVKLK
jgi:endonuclease/exonuclease/phosphatase family metal-dependent hydrolase